jgi:large subunit ribosomal protein L25
VQHDVVTGSPLHADFGEISLSEKISVQIPIRLLGEPEGVKIGGGVLQQVLRTVDVECLPSDIVDYIEADVSHLKLNQSLFVRDLVLGENQVLLTAKNNAVATVTALKAESEEEAEGAEEVAAVPDVIAKGKKEEDAPPAKEPAKK